MSIDRIMHQKTYPLSGTLPSDRGESDQFIDLERLFTIGARRASFFFKQKTAYEV